MDLATYSAITDLVEGYVIELSEKGEISVREAHMICGLMATGHSEDSSENLRGQVVIHLIHFLTD